MTNIILHVRHVDPYRIPINFALITCPMEAGDGHYCASMDDVARVTREMAADPDRTLELVVAGEN